MTTVDLMTHICLGLHIFEAPRSAKCCPPVTSKRQANRREQSVQWADNFFKMSIKTNYHFIRQYVFSIAIVLVVWGMMSQPPAIIVQQEDVYFPTSATATTAFKSGKNTGINTNRTVIGEAPINNRVKEQLAYAMGMKNEVIDVINISNCNPTSSFRVESIDQDSSFSTQSWILISLDEHGLAKTVGGDEVFVIYHDASWNGARSTHVALVTDQSDGTYLLDFWTTPMIPELPLLKNYGSLTIKLMHTCHIGAMAPPTKDSWVHGGLLNTHFVFENVPIPPFSYFEEPQHKSDTNKHINFSQHRLLISFGDSLHKQFVKKGERKWHRPGVYWKQNPDLPLNTTTLPRFLELLEEWHGDELRKGGVGLVIGSAAWDVIHNDPSHTNPDPVFVNHLAACREYAIAVRDRYSAAVVYWRLPYALQPHAVDVPQCLEKAQCRDATRYMSVSRMEYLYHEQKKIMQKLDDILIIDLYKASYLSGEWSPSGDGRHYLVGFNRKVLNWFYNDSLTSVQ